MNRFCSNSNRTETKSFIFKYFIEKIPPFIDKNSFFIEKLVNGFTFLYIFAAENEIFIN